MKSAPERKKYKRREKKREREERRRERKRERERERERERRRRRSVAMVTLTTEMLERGERIMARAATTTTTYSCGGGLLRRGSRAGARVRMSSVNVRRDVVVAKCRAEKKFFELKRKGRKCKSKNGVKCFAALGQDEDLMFILNTIRGAEALDQDPDFYALLGIEHGAAPEVVKQAYRNRARKCHPDIAGEDGHEACIYLNEAYATLMDDELRRSYDRERTEFGSQFSGLKDVMKKAEFAAALTKVSFTLEEKKSPPPTPFFFFPFFNSFFFLFP